MNNTFDPNQIPQRPQPPQGAPGYYAPPASGQPEAPGYDPRQAAWQGAPAQPGYVPGYAYGPAFAPPQPKDPRRTGAAKAFNRMSLVTLFQFLLAFALETPLVWAAVALGVNVLGDGTALTWLEGAMVPLSTALPFLLYMVFTRRGASEYLRFEKVGFVSALLCVLAGLAVCLLANYPAVFVQDLLGNLGYTPADTSMGGATLSGLLLELAVTAVLVPVMEEFAFRGVLLSHLRKYGAGFAIFGSALIFSLVHLDISNVIFAFIAGLVFGYLYVRTENLWVTICIHALNNGLAVFGNHLDLFFDEATAELVDGALMAIPLLLGVAALVLLLIFKRELLVSRRPAREGDLRPLDPVESVVAMVKAPLFWVLVAISLIYTLTLIW